MFLMCVLSFMLFFGGWYAALLPFGCCVLFLFGLKVLGGVFNFVWARPTLPRYRYNQLMRLGWKVFLPLAFGWVIFVASFIYCFSIFCF
jgi:NADH-quinone oxidoreductase subunit H